MNDDQIDALVPLPEPLMKIDMGDDDGYFGALQEAAWNSDYADDMVIDAPMFTAGQLHAHTRAAVRAALAAAGGVPAGWKLGQPITEEMHVAACNVLTRAHGLDGTPQRMLDAMLNAAPPDPAAEPEVPSDVECWERGQPDSIDRAMRAESSSRDAARLALVLRWWFGEEKFSPDLRTALCPEELVELIDKHLAARAALVPAAQEAPSTEAAEGNEQFDATVDEVREWLKTGHAVYLSLPSVRKLVSMCCAASPTPAAQDREALEEAMALALDYALKFREGKRDGSYRRAREALRAFLAPRLHSAEQWAAHFAPMLNGAARDVLAERRRQIEAEGWTPKHDDEHSDGTLALAASCYALAGAHFDDATRDWPWDDSWWKPAAPRRNLVKAGALILAEIERMDRSADAKGGA